MADLDGEWMNRNLVIAAVVLVALSAGGYYAYQEYFTTHKPMKLTASCVKDGCDWQGNIKLNIGDQWPGKCPKCGENTVLDMETCQQCGNRQVLNAQIAALFPEKASKDPVTKCAKCGAAMRH
jgi:predicted RNA-binding Zn-ribbon protein involved in translation (DUF1610 family)